MASEKISTKRVMLDKANIAIVIAVSAACFITIFSLTASKSLLSQVGYQNKVISKKETAKKQLIASVTARDQLVSQYKLFTSNQTNIIGGSATATGDRNGDNAKIILDALPSKYDFPALATSIEKLVRTNGMRVTSIAGTDDEVGQSGTASGDATLVDMPFTLAVEGDYKETEAFMSVLERSIRPIQVQKITFSGSDSQLTTTITAKTYYQSEKTFTLKKETVK